jgi:uncharacterized protein (TIGR03084 family)
MLTTDVIAGLIADLRDEQAELVALLRDQPESVWSVSTPAPRWSVHDQIAHLAHFDGVTRLCVAEPEKFIALRDEMADLQTYVDGIGGLNAHRTGADMLDWWQQENADLLEAVAYADPAVRVPWFGPSMSLASKITARLMETWAHGQDVVDALDLVRPPTDRLRHVARIGVLAFPNSFRARDLHVPDRPVRVRLTAPDGAEDWTWGDEAAPDSVCGPALDFCLVVTQRRHVDDTNLEVTGETARAWMEVAQAFAGPPGQGRRPGQFRRAGEQRVMKTQSRSLEQLRHDLTGYEFPDGALVVEGYEDWIARDCIGSPPAGDEFVHPGWLLFGAFRGMGLTLTELFHLVDAAEEDGVMFGETEIEQIAPLRRDTAYVVHGRITGITRRTGAKVGVFDLVSYELEIACDGEPSARCRNSLVVPRRSAA